MLINLRELKEIILLLLEKLSLPSREDFLLDFGELLSVSEVGMLDKHHHTSSPIPQLKSIIITENTVPLLHSRDTDRQNDYSSFCIVTL